MGTSMVVHCNRNNRLVLLMAVQSSSLGMDKTMKKYWGTLRGTNISHLGKFGNSSSNILWVGIC